MKHIFSTLVVYLREYLHAKSHIAVVLLLAVLMALNFGFPEYSPYINFGSSGFGQVFVFFVLYFGVYSASIAIMQFSIADFVIYKPKQFWAFSVIFHFMYAFSVVFPFDNEVASSVSSHMHPASQVFYFVYKLWVNIKGLLLFVLPALLLLRVVYWSSTEYFGLRVSYRNFWGYMSLIALMTPLLYAASFLPSFLDAYPRYQSYGMSQILDIPEYWSVLSYELAYGLSFVHIEFVMRGVFVLGAAHFLGARAVLPMAAFYVCIHFGKPLGEAISSFFGGYILGVLALQSRNIYGGIWVHVGIAWLMELFAFWQLSRL